MPALLLTLLSLRQCAVKGKVVASEGEGGSVGDEMVVGGAC